MTFDLKLNRFVQITAITCLLSTNSLVAGLQVNYQSPMGEEKWRMTGNLLRCGLSLTIPNYGVGYFEQYATKPPHFILRRWNHGLRELPTQISARSPVWKPNGPNFLVTKSMMKPGNYGVFLDRSTTLKLLTYLSQGYKTQFNYISEEGFNVSVALSPIRFQKVYSKYQRCLGDLLPFNYDNVRESIFHFAVDSDELSNADRVQLRRIAQYVEADERIQKIKILGYADETGRKGYNNAISEYRAKAIEKYLLQLGIPEEKLYVTWFGELKPITRNDTDSGRASNRRVVVDLIRK